MPSVPTALDIRPLAPVRKTATVLATFDRLDVGESFILVNNRDPADLCTCLDAERPNQSRWHYLSSGPPVWYVQIERQSPPL